MEGGGEDMNSHKYACYIYICIAFCEITHGLYISVSISYVCMHVLVYAPYHCCMCGICVSFGLSNLGHDSMHT